MKPLEILALAIMAVGFAMVYAAKGIVRKFNLAQEQVCEHCDEMSKQEIEDYKFSKAVVSFKMKGLAVSIPGLILFILSNR